MFNQNETMSKRGNMIENKVKKITRLQECLTKKISLYLL